MATIYTYTLYTTANPRKGVTQVFTGTAAEFQAHTRELETRAGFLKWNLSSAVGMRR